ncbi:MAG: TlpA family protein disulfide reductase [Treponema sp.]|jgi:thiol-disulfide isomerase/thioredoxin|nr:TlpA family protein disulfide reductase [Treponema sp.]
MKILRTAFLVTLLILGSCTAKVQDAAPDMTKVFAEAGIPLLRQKVSPRNFTLPVLYSTGTKAEDFSLSDLKGKVVFLNFWATWCGPCRTEMPSMESLYNKYKDKGLEILAVNCRETEPEVIAFMRNNNLSFPAALDIDGRVSTSYGIQAIPTTFLVDREGSIILRLVGSIDWDAPKIHTALENLLN